MQYSTPPAIQGRILIDRKELDPDFLGLISFYQYREGIACAKDQKIDPIYHSTAITYRELTFISNLIPEIPKPTDPEKPEQVIYS